MPAQGHSDGGDYVLGQTLRDGERVVLAPVANQDTTPRVRSAWNLRSPIARRASRLERCRRTRRPGYILVLAQVVWRGMRFAQDRREGAFREVDGVDGNFHFAHGRQVA